MAIQRPNLLSVIFFIFMLNNGSEALHGKDEAVYKLTEKLKGLVKDFLDSSLAG